jgi:hypothetical protein
MIYRNDDITANLGFYSQINTSLPAPAFSAGEVSHKSVVAKKPELKQLTLFKDEQTLDYSAIFRAAKEEHERFEGKPRKVRVYQGGRCGENRTGTSSKR